MLWEPLKSNVCKSDLVINSLDFAKKNEIKNTVKTMTLSLNRGIAFLELVTNCRWMEANFCLAIARLKTEKSHVITRLNCHCSLTEGRFHSVSQSVPSKSQRFRWEYSKQAKTQTTNKIVEKVSLCFCQLQICKWNLWFQFKFIAHSNRKEISFYIFMWPFTWLCEKLKNLCGNCWNGNML